MNTLPHTLIAQWSTRNPLPADQFTKGSKKKVWWLCEKGHEWEAAIYARSAGRGCPVCSNRKIVSGINDLATLRPDISSQWHTDNELQPTQVAVQSQKKVKWLCQLGHTYTAKVADRTRRGDGCPYCSGHKILPGFNDLFSTRPELEAEWHPNNTIDPSKVSKGSEVEVLWICAQGHEWRAYINNRLRTGCPKCTSSKNPKIEIALLNELAKRYSNLEHQYNLPFVWSTGKISQVDFLINDNIVIEYDGDVWHKQESRVEADIRKTTALLERGYFVVRIRENALEHLPLEHPRLVQMNYRYSTNPDRINDLLDKISQQCCAQSSGTLPK